MTSSGGIAAARRTFGPRGDQGSTTGGSPAPAWVVPAGTAASSGVWTLSLANPGSGDADVELWLVASDGLVRDQPPRHVVVPAGRTVVLGPGFTEHAPLGAIVAVASHGSFVPMASSFTGSRGSYSVAVGEAIPARWVPSRPA